MASVRKNEAALKAEAFPLASLLGGVFFMSGVGLVAVSAHPTPGSERDVPDFD
jgi:hypothetical protein